MHKTIPDAYLNSGNQFENTTNGNLALKTKTRAKIIPLHKPKKTNPRSPFLVSKSNIEYPVHIKIIEKESGRQLEFENLSLRLHLMNLHHARFRNDNYSAYVDKSKLNELKETIKAHSSNAWTIKIVK